MIEAAILDLLDALYQQGGSEEAWIFNLARAADVAIGRGGGAVAYTYEIVSPRKATVRAAAGYGTRVRRIGPVVRETVEGVSEPMVRGAPALAVAAFSQTGALCDPVLRSYADQLGSCDVLMLNAALPNGVGCMLAIHAPETVSPDAAAHPVISRLARHLARGVDLRLGAGTGSLGGFPVRGPSNLGAASLSAREREVVLRLVAGQRPKEVAFELGLAPSTVRVLIARAMAKLRVRNSRELVALLERTSDCSAAAELRGRDLPGPPRRQHRGPHP